MGVECTTMSYSDYGDYGDEPRRPSRRAAREPAGPAKVQGSTAAAILVFVAIVGFGIGAIIGNSGGDDQDPAAAQEQDGAPLGTPNDQTTSPDDTEADDGTDEGDGTDDGENSDDEVTGGEGITLTSQQDGGEVPAGESGTIDVQATLDSGEEGVTLRVERSLDGGQTWEPFCDACTDETSGSGSYSTNFWTGQTGENQFRVVGPDGLASNPISVNVVDSEGDDSG